MTDLQFIAEVSSNHNKDLNRCRRFIEVAAELGCSAVKFQLFKIERLFAPEALSSNETFRKRKEWELPLEFIPVLSQECRQRGLKFACTPFYLEAVEELKPYVDFLKIASYEIFCFDLIRLCADTGLPVVLSTGMATLAEVSAAVRVLQSSGAKDFALLHCVSSYPVAAENCNLSAIQTLREKFHCPVGWSDHSVCEEVIYRAVYKWGAELIEFHLDLDGKGEEFQSGHCWLPDKIGQVIARIKRGVLADGSGQKVPLPTESKERSWRADPSDGLRPLLATRKSLKKE
jgi:N-acetylneuraminate synthase